MATYNVGGPITLVNAAAGGGGTLTSQAMNMPTGYAVGDLLLALVTSRDNQTHGVSQSGWAQVLTQWSNSATQQVSIWYKFATSTAEAFTLTRSIGTAVVVARIAAYRGVDRTSPFQVGTANNTSNASGGAPGAATAAITTDRDGVVLLHCYLSTTATSSAVTYTTPTGITGTTYSPGTYAGGSSTNRAGIGWWSTFQNTQASSGTASVTSIAPACQDVGIILALRPAFTETSTPSDSQGTGIKVNRTVSESQTASAETLAFDVSSPPSPPYADAGFPDVATEVSGTSLSGTLTNTFSTPGGSRLLVAVVSGWASGQLFGPTVTWQGGSAPNGASGWVQRADTQQGGGDYVGVRIFTAWAPNQLTNAVAQTTEPTGAAGSYQFAIWSVNGASQTIGNTGVQQVLASGQGMQVAITAAAIGNLMIGGLADNNADPTLTPAGLTVIPAVTGNPLHDGTNFVEYATFSAKATATGSMTVGATNSDSYCCSAAIELKLGASTYNESVTESQTASPEVLDGDQIKFPLTLSEATTASPETHGFGIKLPLTLSEAATASPETYGFGVKNALTLTEAQTASTENYVATETNPAPVAAAESETALDSYALATKTPATVTETQAVASEVLDAKQIYPASVVESQTAADDSYDSKAVAPSSVTESQPASDSWAAATPGQLFLTETLASSTESLDTRGTALASLTESQGATAEQYQIGVRGPGLVVSEAQSSTDAQQAAVTLPLTVVESQSADPEGFGAKTVASGTFSEPQTASAEALASVGNLVSPLSVSESETASASTDASATKSPAILVESASTSEAVEVGKVLAPLAWADSASPSDSYAGLPTIGRSLTESQASSDSATFQTTSLLTTALSILSQINDTFVETETASESVTAAGKLLVSVSESELAGDAVSVRSAVASAVTETASASESLSGLVTTTVQLSTTLSLLLQANDGLLEAVSSSDSTAASLVFGRTFSESSTGSDSESAAVALPLTVTESQASSDAVSAKLTVGLAVAESATGTEAATSTDSLPSVAFTEAQSASESLSYTVVSGPTYVLETISAGESEDSRLVLPVTLTESVTGSSTQLAGRASLASLTESATGSDSQTSQTTRIVSTDLSMSLPQEALVSESASASDGFSFSLALGVSLAETAVSSDVGTTAAQELASLAETSTAQDSEQSGLLSVALGVVESVSGDVSFSYALPRTGTVSESVTADATQASTAVRASSLTEVATTGNETFALQSSSLVSTALSILLQAIDAFGESAAPSISFQDGVRSGASLVENVTPSDASVSTGDKIDVLETVSSSDAFASQLGAASGLSESETAGASEAARVALTASFVESATGSDSETSQVTRLVSTEISLWDIGVATIESVTSSTALGSTARTQAALVESASVSGAYAEQCSRSVSTELSFILEALDSVLEAVASSVVLSHSVRLGSALSEPQVSSEDSATALSVPVHDSLNTVFSYDVEDAAAQLSLDLGETALVDVTFSGDKTFNEYQVLETASSAVSQAAGVRSGAALGAEAQSSSDSLALDFSLHFGFLDVQEPSDALASKQISLAALTETVAPLDATSSANKLRLTLLESTTATESYGAALAPIERQLSEAVTSSSFFQGASAPLLSQLTESQPAATLFASGLEQLEVRAESETATDSMSGAARIAAGVSEAVTPSELFSSTSRTAASLQETVQSADAWVPETRKEVTLLESQVAGDGYASKLSAPAQASLQEQVAATESLSSAVRGVSALAESQAATTSERAGLSQKASFGETVTGLDSTAPPLQVSVGERTETALATESFQSKVTARAAVSESLTSVDSVQAASVSNVFTTEAVTSSEVSTSVTTYDEVLADWMRPAAGYSSASQLRLAVPLVETVTASDLLFACAVFRDSQLEAVTPLAAEEVHGRLGETLLVSASASAQLGSTGAGLATVVEPVLPKETAAAAVRFPVSLVLTAGSGDSWVGAQSFEADLAETALPPAPTIFGQALLGSQTVEVVKVSMSLGEFFNDGPYDEVPPQPVGAAELSGTAPAALPPSPSGSASGNKRPLTPVGLADTRTSAPILPHAPSEMGATASHGPTAPIAQATDGEMIVRLRGVARSTGPQESHVPSSLTGQAQLGVVPASRPPGPSSGTATSAGPRPAVLAGSATATHQQKSASPSGSAKRSTVRPGTPAVAATEEATAPLRVKGKARKG